MAARDGMSTLISDLRTRIAAGTADYSIAGTAYWTDEQLQEVLDEHRTDYRQVELRPVAEYVSNDHLYHDYLIPQSLGRFFEQASGGTAVWRVYDETGATQGTANYTVNYRAGIIRFTADQNGETRYLDVRTFAMEMVAADVWRRKAAHAAGAVDWATDNHKVSGSQEMQHCLEMAAYYESQSGMQVVKMHRSDVIGYG